MSRKAASDYRRNHPPDYRDLDSLPSAVMATKDLGPLFFDSVRSYDHPWCSPAYSQETEEPYRKGHGIAIRVTKRFVLVIGWWRRPSQMTEDEALFTALKASEHRAAGPIAEGEAWLGADD